MSNPPVANEATSPASPAKRLQALRGRAHALRPVVWIASTGLTEGVLRELDRALTAHELIKIHAAIDDRQQRSRLLLTLCRSLGAEPVQTIGKMLVAFRARPQSEAVAPTAAASEKKKTSKPSVRIRKPSERPAKRPAKRARTAARRT